MGLKIEGNTRLSTKVLDAELSILEDGSAEMMVGQWIITLRKPLVGGAEVEIMNNSGTAIQVTKEKQGCINTQLLIVDC